MEAEGTKGYAWELPTVRLGLVCAALAGGEALGLQAGGGAAAWPLAAGGAVLVALLGFGARWQPWPVAFFFALGLALAMRADFVRRKALVEIGLCNRPYEEVFRVERLSRAGAQDADGGRWVSFATACAAGPLTVVFRLGADGTIPQAGDRWRCAGWFDVGDIGDRRGRTLWVRGEGTFARREGPAGSCAWTAWLARVRQELSRRLGIGLEDRPLAAGLNRAMLLGERARLPWELTETFRQAGTVHVFAISGLHVLVVAQVLLYLLVLTLFPIRWAGVAVLPVLWLYVQLIGAPPSAVRAVAMTGICYLASAFWRRPDALTAWELTLIGCALADPIGLFGVGSMLSFSVVLGILLFVRWTRLVRLRALTWIGVPVVAWAAGVPIAARVFSQITPGGLLANLVTVPAACAAVVAGAFGLLSSGVSERMAAHANNVAALCTDLMTGVSWAVARLPWAKVETRPWPLWTCAAWYAGVGLLFVWIRMVRTRRRGGLD